MILDVFTFCYNEEQRLPWFLNLYGPIARSITVFDNGSDDKSEEIGTSWDNVIWDKKKYYLNEIVETQLTHLKCNAWKQSDADLVLIVDIDELLYHPDGLPEFFASKTKRGFTMFKPQAYDMVCEDLPEYTPGKNVYEFSQCTYGFRHNFFDKVCVFSPKDIKQINYGHGCHRSRPTGNVRIYCDDPEYKLLHYKYPSKELYTKQISSSYTRLSDFNRERELGFEYHDDVQKASEEFDEVYNKRKPVI